MPRQRRERETPEIAAMVERMVKAYGRRVADADDVDLVRMQEVLGVFEDVFREAGRVQLERYSLAQLGRALGISKQAVHQRFGREQSA